MRVFAFLLFFIFTFAAQASDVNKKTAIMVVNTEYPEINLNRDLQDKYKLGKTLSMQGFDVIFLNNIDRDSLNLEINKLNKKTNSDLLLVYLFGFGVLDSKDNSYFMTFGSSIDVDDKYANEDGVLISNFVKSISDIKSSIRIIVNNSCMINSSTREDSGLKEKRKVQQVSNGLIYFELQNCNKEEYENVSKSLDKSIQKNIQNNGRIISFIEDVKNDFNLLNKTKIKIKEVVTVKSNELNKNMFNFEQKVNSGSFLEIKN